MAYIGNDLQVAFPSYRIIDDISSGFNGSQKTFALNVGGATPVPFPINPQQCLISVNGVIQKPDPTGASGFNLVGSNIVFASAPTGGWSFFGVILAGADYVNVGANFPSGSAAAPSITFDSDTDTGIYNSGANQVSITTAGLERFRVDSAGQLEAVSLGSAASPAFSFTTDTNTGIYSPGADQLAISTNGTGRLFINSAGNAVIGSSTAQAFSGFTTLTLDNATNGGVLCINKNAVNMGNISAVNDALTIDAANGGSSPIVFRTGAATTERVRITTGGLVGIGTSSPGSLLEIKSAASADCKQTVSVTTATQSAFTAFVNTTVSTVGTENSAGGNLVSGSSPYATILSNNSAYPIQFGTNNTVRATLDSSGRLGIGTTSPGYLLDLSASTPVLNIASSATSGDGAQIRFVQNNGRVGRLYLTSESGTGAGAMTLENPDGRDIIFRHVSNERARIDSSGRLLVGTSDGSGSVGRIIVQGASNGSATGVLQIAYNGSATAPLTAGTQLGFLRFTDQASSGQTFAEIRAEVDATTGANDYPGRLVFSTTADGASSPTERMRINNGGDIHVAKISTGIGTVGCTIQALGTYWATRSGGALGVFNRQASDGNLIEFYQDDALEGTISVSGTTVSYNGAHLSRWSQLQGIDPCDKDQRPEILRGTVMSNLDEMCDWTCPESGDCQDNEQLNKTKISEVEGDKNVAGVFQGWDDDDDTWVNDFYLAMTGDFVIRIAAGVSVERGDLLMSAGDGTAKPQEDDIIRSKTIAKVTSTNVSCTYEDGSYCVPCVLMAC